MVRHFYLNQMPPFGIEPSKLRIDRISCGLHIFSGMIVFVLGGIPQDSLRTCNTTKLLFISQCLSQFLEKSCAPEIHPQLVNVEMQDALVVLRCGTEHDKFDAGSFHRLLRKTEQRSADSLASVAGNHIEFLNLKKWGSVCHDGTCPLRLLFVSEQVSQDLTIPLCQKDSVSLNVAAVSFRNILKYYTFQGNR